MAVRYVEIGQYPDVRREVRGNLSEILVAAANPGTYAAPEDVTGTFLEMGTDGKWYGDLGTMPKATADALHTSGALANLATGATYRDVNGTQYTYSAGAGWVAGDIGPGSPSTPFATIAERTAWAAANLSSLRSGASTVWGPGNVKYVWNGPLATDWAALPVSPEQYFVGVVPIGWLPLMLAAGVRDISLSRRTYPCPTTTPDTKLDVSAYPSVRIYGIRPVIAGDSQSLVSGSIIQGGLALINPINWSFRDLGCDLGPAYNVLNISNPSLYPMSTVCGISFTAGSNNTTKRTTHLFPAKGTSHHGILVNSSPGTKIFDTITKYGTHGIAIKSTKVRVIGLASSECNDSLIVKSDPVALGTGYYASDVFAQDISGLNVDNVAIVQSGGTAADGATIRNVRIIGVSQVQDTYNLGAACSAVTVLGTGAADEAYDIFADAVESLRADYAINVAVPIPVNVGFGSLSHKNGYVSIRARLAGSDFNAQPISVESLTSTDIDYLWYTSNFSRVHIGQVIGKHVTAPPMMVDTSFVTIGSNKIIDATNPNKIVAFNAHAYANSCADYAGNSNPFRLDLRENGVVGMGEVAPGTAVATPNYEVMTIPRQCRPLTAQTIPVLASISGGTSSTLLATVSTVGVVTLASLPANVTYLAFALRWRL